MTKRHATAIFFVVSLLLPVSAFSKFASKPENQPLLTLLPRDFGISYEGATFTNSAGVEETIGLLGLSYGLEVLPNFNFSLGSYGAISGQRAGFIVFGVALDYDLPLIEVLRLNAGLFVGGGGGGSAPQGGGLVVRPSLALKWKLQDVSISMGYSYITFPSGNIHDGHPFLAMALPSDIALLLDEGKPDPSARSVLSLQRNLRVFPRAVAYITKNKTKMDGTPLGSSVKLLGFATDYFYTKNIYATFELLGAVSGGASGYMSILGGAGQSFIVDRGIRFETELKAGYAGGGLLNLGGGLLFHPSAQFTFQLGSVWAQLGGGLLFPVSSTFRVPTAHMALGTNFDVLTGAETSKKKEKVNFDRALRKLPLQLSLTSARYLINGKTATAIASDGSTILPALDLLGFSADYSFSRFFSFSAATYWAYGGKSGGYASGLVGLGLSIPVFDAFYWQSHIKGGAGAGGRVPVGEGLMGTFDTGIGIPLSEVLSLQLSGGYARFFGGISTLTVEGGLSFSLGLPLAR